VKNWTRLEVVVRVRLEVTLMQLAAPYCRLEGRCREIL
jgi:hypothetical protein